MPGSPDTCGRVFLRDRRASETRARVKITPPEEGKISRALAFRSLYYPWGKMVTTRSLVDVVCYVHSRFLVSSRNALPVTTLKTGPQSIITWFTLGIFSTTP